jgi:hypothetical protein
MKRASPWLPEEDEALREYAVKCCNNFDLIANKLQEDGWFRTSKQCRKRMYVLRLSVAKPHPEKLPIYKRDVELWNLGRLWLAGKLGGGENVSE